MCIYVYACMNIHICVYIYIKYIKSKAYCVRSVKSKNWVGLSPQRLVRYKVAQRFKWLFLLSWTCFNHLYSLVANLLRLSVSIVRRGHIYIKGREPSHISSRSSQTHAAKCSRSSDFGRIQMASLDYSSNSVLMWEFKDFFCTYDGTHSQTVLDMRYTRKDPCLVVREQIVLWGESTDDSPYRGVSVLTEGGDRNTGTGGRGVPEGLCWSWFGVSPTYPIVSGLVLIVNPVQALIGPVLHTVLGHPLVDVTAPLGEDPRNHLDLLQIYLQPLAAVLELGEPCAPAADTASHQEPFPVSASKELGGAVFWGDASTWRAPTMLGQSELQSVKHPEACLQEVSGLCDTCIVSPCTSTAQGKIVRFK